MSELPPPNPFPSPSAADRGDASSPRRIENPAALFGVAVACGVLAAGSVGGGVGWAVAGITNADCAPHDGWCSLGGLIFGLLAGAVAAVVAYVVTGVVVIVRCRPSGSRAAHIAAFGNQRQNRPHPVGLQHMRRDQMRAPIPRRRHFVGEEPQLLVQPGELFLGQEPSEQPKRRPEAAQRRRLFARR